MLDKKNIRQSRPLTLSRSGLVASSVCGSVLIILSFRVPKRNDPSLRDSRQRCLSLCLSSSAVKKETSRAAARGAIKNYGAIYHSCQITDCLPFRFAGAVFNWQPRSYALRGYLNILSRITLCRAWQLTVTGNPCNVYSRFTTRSDVNNAAWANSKPKRRVDRFIKSSIIRRWCVFLFAVKTDFVSIFY